MEMQGDENSQQFVLDHRKLVVAFALLIVVCGSFFVIGFMEGKRQGQRSVGKAGDSTQATMQSRDGATSAPSGSGATRQEVDKSQAARAGGQPVDWYQSMSRRGDEAISGIEAPRKASPPAGTQAVETKSQSTTTAAAREAASEKALYSVQVGAFRSKKEAEVKASGLKAKKYDYYLESSGPPDNLLLLKVGRFESRAEAVAMQRRLKQDGFATFIKATR